MYNGGSDMSRLALLVLAGCALFAQQEAADLFRKAPPDVDSALRDRVTKFYQAHVDGKPRLAEQYVAEDTKDFFYDSNKPKYLSFEIRKIDYSADFTQATVTMFCEQNVLMPGFAGSHKIPHASYWKLDEGKWAWYVDKKILYKTPFGDATPGPGKGGSLPAPFSVNAVQELQARVKSDRERVLLKSGRDEVVGVANGLEGSVTLSLEHQPIEGFEASLDRAVLKSGEKAVVTLSAKKSPPKPMGIVVNIRVQPLNKVIPIAIVWQ